MALRPDPVSVSYIADAEPEHSQQSITIFESAESRGSSTPGPWVIYIHGGAWRDPTEDKRMGYPLLARTLPGGWSGASIDYRLSPAVQHPTHMNDVLQALRYLNSKYSMESIVLVGHSAGACIALQILAELTALTVASKELGSERLEDGYLGDKIKAVVAVEGIYDLKGLVEEYPDYRSFVAMAFGDDELEWSDASPSSFNWPQLKEGSNSKIILVQSSQDELLSTRQTMTMKQALDPAQWSNELKIVDGGSHNGTVTSDALYEVVKEVYSVVENAH
ncbi:Alpha/Beta hydrolase protein [Myxozyma melibiosi]|uniref:Kynurenine formamidase n=1 Tax=Myxozyma melibiosi TaxID=54550 RepID=A0ABR1F3R9_9ASCO